MGSQKRNMPSVLQVLKYWDNIGLTTLDMDRRTCFKCLWQCPKPYNLERAHIIARCEGGPDIPENLVLLCHSCHVETDGWTQIDWHLFLFDRKMEYANV